MKFKINILFALLFSVSLLSFVSAADPGHSSGVIGPGTFETGNYVFPNNLTINSFLGIGTSTPSRALDVRGIGNFSGTVYINNGTDIAALVSGADDWNVSGSNLFPLSLAYNVGIGTASPSAKLDVRGGSLFVRSNTAGAHYLNITGIDGSGTFVTDNYGWIRFKTGSGAVYDSLYLGATGNVGIGTTTPSRALDVRGIGNFSGTVYINNGTDITSLISGADDWNVSGSNLFPLSLSYNLGIGTSTPSRALDVRGIGNFSGTVYINNRTDLSANLTSIISNAQANSTSLSYLYGQNTSLWNAALSTFNDTYDALNIANYSLRNLIANNVYNDSILGFQYTNGKPLISGTLNRVIFSRDTSYTTNLSKVRTPGYYSVSLWYKVADFNSGTTLNPNLNDVSLGTIDVSSNRDWTYWSGTAYISQTAYGFIDFEGTFVANITLSDISVIRSFKPTQQYVPAPEDLIRYDASGKVGIGIASPNASLQIAPPSAGPALIVGRVSGSPNVKAGSDNYLIMDSSGQYVSLNHYVTDNVILAYGGGKVGIGTVTPSTALDVRGVGNFSGTVYINNRTDLNANLTSLWVEALNKTNGSYVPYTGATGNVNLGSWNISTTGYLTWDVNNRIGTTAIISGGSQIITLDSNANTANAFFSVEKDSQVSGSGTELFRVQEDGNVGIGTASPLGKLHINMTAVAGKQNLTNITRTDSNLIRITNPQYSTDASAGILLRVFPDSDARQGAGILASGGVNNAVTDLDLLVSKDAGGATTSTTYSALKILGNSGYVGIGTTAPNTKLHIEGSSVDIRQNATSGNNYYSLLSSVNYDSGNSWSVNFSTVAGVNSQIISYISPDVSKKLTLGATGGSVILNGKVGIGTTTPPSRLSISNGSGSFTAAQGVADPDIALQFDNYYDNAGNSGPNKILLYNESSWQAGMGISSSTYNFFSGADYKFYTGSTPTTPGSTRLSILSGGNISANSGFITNVANPISAQDVATKAYVDASNTSAGSYATYTYVNTNVNANYTAGLTNTSSSYVPYVGARSNTALGIYNLTTLGMVGIGTATPSAGLQVNVVGGNANASIQTSNNGNTLYIIPSSVSGGLNSLARVKDSAIIFSNGSQGYGSLLLAPWSGTRTGLRVGQNGTEVVGTFNISNAAGTLGLFQDHSGYVGIGTIPSAQLEVSNSTGSAIRISNANTNIQVGDIAGRLDFYKADASTGGAGVPTYIQSRSTDLGGLFALDFITGSISAPVNTLTLGQTGNVGIGTNAPTSNLEIRGTFNVTNASGGIALTPTGDFRIGI